MSTELTRSKTGWKGDPKITVHFAALKPALITKVFGTGTTIRTYFGKGCEVCHDTGYKGRVGIFEVLEVTPAIEQLISQKASADAITKQAVIEGMTTMLDDGLGKVQRGITTMEEIVRATRE